MHDPFIIAPIPWLSKAVQPFADYFSLTTLPLHIHEVVLSFLGYTFINLVFAPWISKVLFPQKYAALSNDRKINWNVHVVSLCQSTMINTLALYVMFFDEERKSMDWTERIWGYTGGAGMIQGLATGYFLWDLMVTLQNVKLFGYGMLAHALSALLVFSFGFVSSLLEGIYLRWRCACANTAACRDPLSTTTAAHSSFTNSPPHS